VLGRALLSIIRSLASAPSAFGGLAGSPDPKKYRRGTRIGPPAATNHRTLTALLDGSIRMSDDCDEAHSLRNPSLPIHESEPTAIRRVTLCRLAANRFTFLMLVFDARCGCSLSRFFHHLVMKFLYLFPKKGQYTRTLIRQLVLFASMTGSTARYCLF
jgi:hypothetical protein